MKRFVLGSTTMLLLLLILSCTTDQNRAIYRGRLYNSNDGTCSIAGEQLDFYIDGIFIATINSGESLSTELEEGLHTFRVKLTSTGEVLEPGYQMTIEGENWWYRYGCNDGSYPRSMSPIILHTQSIFSYGGYQ